jgi:hypothetical protein
MVGGTSSAVCIGLSESNKLLALRYFKAYETGNIDVVMQFTDPDYVLRPGGTARSMNTVERKCDETVSFSAFSGIKSVVEDQIAEGDKVGNWTAGQDSLYGHYPHQSGKDS